MVLTKICMPPQRCLPSPGPTVVGWVGTCGLKGGSLCWCLGKLPRQKSCRGRGGCPGRGLAGGLHLAPLLSCVSGLGVASDHLVPLASLRLPSLALLSVAVGAAPTVRAQVKGSKGAPLLLYTDNVLLGSFACLVGIIVYLLKIKNQRVYGSSSTC